LKNNQDYGVIPGTNGKPTLLKPGAANLIAAFNCHLDGDDKCALEIMDPDKGKYGFVAYRIVVRIVSNNDGSVRAMGQGSCNSFEGKYRYRNAKPLCPECGKETIFKSKFEPGFYCFGKAGGCGAKFSATDKAILSQKEGRVENENPLDLANTILKIAIKRATTDAALQLPGVARFFTQDLDDMLPPDTQERPATPTKAAPQVVTAQSRPATPTKAAAPAQPQTAQPTGNFAPAQFANAGDAMTAWNKRYEGGMPAVYLRLSRLTGETIKTPQQITSHGPTTLEALLCAEDNAIQDKHKAEVIDATVIDSKQEGNT
jgi:hypothetical protein